MNIEILHMTPGAAKAKGVTVIIDVFRAFSFESWALNNGAEATYPIADIDAAYELHKEHPDWMLAGERGGKKCEGFDFGNSPSSVSREIVAGKSIVHTTSAGTQGIANASRAEEVITGSLVNAKAIAEYIRRKNPEVVSLVCMGTNATSPADEDELCAAYIKSLLEDAPLNIAEEAAALRDGAGAKFFNPDTQEIFPEPDFWMCSKYDLFDFVIRVTPKEDYFETEKISVLK
jgi:2-phosphosulfolactate phosphatase